MENISNQTFKKFEHLIIDGASNDGTLAYLASIDQSNRIWVSEPDKGIYNAMNKGLLKSKGQWVVFMNAGDQFFSQDTLEHIPFLKEEGIIYGACEINYPNGYKRLMLPAPLTDLWKGMSFSHQSVFVEKKMLQTGFDEQYKLSADFHFIFNSYLSKNKFTALKSPVCIIDAGGVSDKKRYKATAEVYKINKRLAPKLKIHFYFIPKIIIGFIVVKIKSILPKKVLNKLLTLKYQ